MIEKIILVFWIHWVADFVLQTDTMAKNKSTSNKWLLSHVSVYTIPFFIFGWKFALVNGAAHFVTDYFTSRINSRLYKAGKIHEFFVGVGFDQAVHATTLVLTLEYLT